jgi:uncharacterized membrane protein YphA (DoxX/SURF4 family)
MISKGKLKSTIRIIVGLTFIVSAISKLISIDSFEIYLYGFGIIKLEYAFVLARLIISLELLTGIVLIVGMHTRVVLVAAITMLSVFSVFILFLFLTRNQEHCHCFGEIEMSHPLSLLKNILLILLLVLSYQRHNTKFRYDKIVFIIIVFLSGLIPLVISPPDSFFYSKYSKTVTYDEFMLNEFLKENNQYTRGKKILCFFSTGCRFCKLSARKISVIAKKANDGEIVNYVFAGTGVFVDKFFEETNSTIFPYSFLSPNRFLKITNGEMPLIILLEDGNIKGKYAYRDIIEEEIIRFMMD